MYDYSPTHLAIHIDISDVSSSFANSTFGSFYIYLQCEVDP